MRHAMLLAWACCATAAQAQEPPTLPARVDRAVTAAMTRTRVPGAVVAVVRGDSILALRGVGFASIEDRAPADPQHSAYRLASVAKLFVATTILQRTAAGHLSLDRPVRDWLGELPRVGARVTLRHLVTHTSGLDDRVVAYGAPSRAAMRPLGDYLAARLPDQHWAPGEVVSYSNHGMALAALVAEREAGVTYDELARREVFAPLGMTRTWYVDPPGDSVGRHQVPGYRCGDSDCERAPVVWSHAYPVGLAFSTAADMSRFLLAFTADSSPLATSTRETALRRLFTHDPRIPGIGAAFFEQQWKGHTLFTHAGGVPGTSTVLAIAPDARLGVFIATNAGEPGFVREVLDSVLVATLPDRTPPPPVASGSVAEYVGTWRLGRFAHRTIERFPATFAFSMRTWRAGDTLHFLAGSTRRDFVRIDSLLLQEVHDGSRMALRRDATGRVTHLFAGVPSAGSELPGGLERAPWYEAPYFLNEYVSWLLLGPLIVLGTWGVVAVGLWLRARRRPRATGPASPVVPVVVAVASLAAFMLFGFGFVAASTRDLSRGAGIAFGMTIRDVALLRLAWPIALAALPIGWWSIQAWRLRWWNAFGRCCYSLVALGAAGAAHFLAWWGYIPGRW